MHFALKYLLGLLILASTFEVFAQTSEFDSNHTYETEETITSTPGQTVRKVRSGKIRPSSSDEAVGEIYEGDVGRLETRIRAKRFWSFGFGPSGLTDAKEDKDSKMVYTGTIARIWEASSRGEIRFRATGASGETGSFASAGLGGAFLPSRDSISPIIGAEFGGGAASGKENSSGFTLGAYGGLRFFRLADAQLELLASYTTILTNTKSSLYGAQLSLMF